MSIPSGWLNNMLQALGTVRLAASRGGAPNQVLRLAA